MTLVLAPEAMMEPKVRSTVCECECVNVSAGAHVLDECVNECTYVWRAGCTGPKILKEEAWQCTVGCLALFQSSAARIGVEQEEDPLGAQVSGPPESWLNCCLHWVQLHRPLC